MMVHDTLRFSSGMLPLSGSLLPLSQRRYAFAATFPEVYVAHLVVGLCCHSSQGSPSYFATPFHIAPLLLFSLDSHHPPLVAPHPPTAPTIR
jgi:hypothetical protein